MIVQILLQAQTGSNPMFGNLILIGGIIVIFYFFMIRPQQKKQKDQKKFLEAIKKGDPVVTMGGIHGRISSIDGEVVTIDVDRGTKLRIERSALSLDSSKRVAASSETKD
jgi:preprotein translocase subunit YajC